MMSWKRRLYIWSARITLLTTVVVGLGVSLARTGLVNTPQHVHVATLNCDTIENIARICALLENNSDLAARLSHYTDGHVTKHDLCPECYGREHAVVAAQQDGRALFCSTAPEQMVQDAEDIHLACQQILAGLSCQYHSLDHALNGLKENYPPGGHSHGNIAGIREIYLGK